MKREITAEDLERFEGKFDADKVNRVAMNAAAQAGVNGAGYDADGNYYERDAYMGGKLLKKFTYAMTRGTIRMHSVLKWTRERYVTRSSQGAAGCLRLST